MYLQSKEKAEKSISLNGIEFKGNHLRITLATKPESQDNGEAKRTVLVGNLKYSASEESLREIFSSCGEIEYVRCIRDGDKGCKGVAYVCFNNADAVGLALELNETIVDERSIHVERYNVNKLAQKSTRGTGRKRKSKWEPN
ncbi:Nucleolar protein 12 [Eumeta japonica]|uniref:Nucleolar protein 12 n=1 Tax=Eumeta variegata TaxID=151549 RepID=A0A4C1SRX6_EUMVA|nr:Nucleolar protein 12 [Eumeta japonica]